jgi:hypothetical protein
MRSKVLLLALPWLLASTLHAQDLCAGRKGSATVESLKAEGGFVEMSGKWTASPETERLALEIRIDQDRQALEVHEGASGTWSARVPFAYCGKHLLRVYVFAAVAQPKKTTLCFEGAPSTPRPFEIDCTPLASLDACSFDCPKPKAPVKGAAPAPGAAVPSADVVCKATCKASAQGGAGSITAMVKVGSEPFQIVDGPVAGPWDVNLTCKIGDKITFMIRDRSGTGAASKPAERECGKQ